MKALVLSGGGVKGAYQAGAVAHLIGSLRNYYPIVCGVSVGAINAAHIVQYARGEEVESAVKLVDLWHRITTDQVHKRWFPFGKLHGLWQPSLLNSSPLREFLTKNLAADAILSSGRRLRLGAVSVDTGEYKAFTELCGDIVGAVLASASFPGMLLPVQLSGTSDKELYTDGGVKNVTPLADAINLGATEIDVVLTAPLDNRYEALKKPNALDVLVRCAEIMSDEIIENDLHVCERVNKLADGSKYRKVRVRVIRPEFPLCQDALSFDHKEIKDMIAKGLVDAKRAFPVLDSE